MTLRPQRWSLSSLFQFRTRARPEPVRVQRARNPFHAVSVKADWRRPCRAARELGERRFLAGEAPTLPLPGCNGAACTCRYEHHDDRREDLRRAADEGRAEHPYSGPERRAHRGRRRRD